MINTFTYWDNGFPIGLEDADNINHMIYWDNGFPFIYISSIIPPPSTIVPNYSKFFFFF